MDKLKFICLIFTLTLMITGLKGDSNHWGYGKKDGPYRWCMKFSNSSCCGHLQSPISLYHNKSTLVHYPELKFHSYENSVGVNLTDNGHTVVAVPANSGKAKIEGAHLNGTYILNSFHFHWGDRDIIGSEHSVNNKKFSLEVHFVHYNEKYSTLKSAQRYPDGLAVLAVFLEASSKVKTNRAFEPIINALDSNIYDDEYLEINDTVILNHLIPNDTTRYFTYRGSLTTPPCLEVVKWIVFDQLVYITEDQMKMFRNNVYYETENKAKADGKKDILEDNFRPIQYGYNRTVYYNFPSNSSEFDDLMDTEFNF